MFQSKSFYIGLVVTILLVVGQPQVVLAVGNTSSDTSPGQVKTSSKDGALYLTTQVNKDQAKAVGTPNSQAKTQKTIAQPGEEIVQPQGFAKDLGSYINSLLALIIVVCLLLTFLHFIQAGIQWITSGGDKGKTEEARNKIVHAIIGIIIVSSSFAVASFVAYILGFNSINDALNTITPINPS